MESTLGIVYPCSLFYRLRKNAQHAQECNGKASAFWITDNSKIRFCEKKSSEIVIVLSLLLAAFLLEYTKRTNDMIGLLK